MRWSRLVLRLYRAKTWAYGGEHEDRIEDTVSATTFANPTDVVNISFALEDYPYQQDDPPAPQRQILQGRVVAIDSIGIVLASNGDNIMPSFNDSRDELTLPARGDLFPWAAIKRVAFVATGAEYGRMWRIHRAQQAVFMDAKDMRPPANDSEYRTWARAQDHENLQRRIKEAFDAEPAEEQGNDGD
jgi:hypothetical protein